MNIMIVGVGGQGTLLASRILGRVAIKEGYDVKVSEVHGMSQRGGSVVTYVKFGDKVYSPIISRIYKENMPKDANGNPQVDPNMFSQMFGGTGANPFAGQPGSGNPGFDPSMFKDATAK